MTNIQIVQDSNELKHYIQEARLQGKTIGLVPTMGALHEGHLQMIKNARQQCDYVIVSIFVNPAQFSQNEDYHSYPRQEAQDFALLQQINVDIVFLPGKEDIYPTGFDSAVVTGGASIGLEGQYRPHFFKGVCTILTKLFIICTPDKVFFGEKDYQQYCVVKKLIYDFNFPIEIIPIPTIRASNGLALSSRNAYLKEEQLKIASRLYQTLCRLGQDILNGGNVTKICDQGAEELLTLGFQKVDYLELYHIDGWMKLNKLVCPARLFVAAWLDNVRLIDNIAIA